MLIVQKYGGSSVANAERIRNVAARIAETYDAGNSVVVILSAPGDMTDDLIARAKEINPGASKRELDMLLSTGEQQSVALMAMALHSMGKPAVSLIAMQAGIQSTSAYSNARIKKIEAERIQAEIDRRNIVIVAGFQGVNRYGDVTTLGRGASDTTAVAIAAALHADLCEIYTDVDGIYTTDPRKVDGARKLETISYDEMLELASLGAQVLHNRSVELAKKYNVKMVVRSSMTKNEGTLIKDRGGKKVESMFVSGVAVDYNVSRISLVGIKDVPGTAFRIFSALAKNKISVDIILQSIGRDGTKDISFTIAASDIDEALTVLDESIPKDEYLRLDHDENIAKLSIVGAGMESNFGVAASFFEALYQVSVNIGMISTSEIKISVLIPKEDAERGRRAVHDKFFAVESK